MKFHHGTRSVPTTLHRELAVGNRSSLPQESGRESEFSPTGVGNRSSLLQESVLDWARVLGKVATGRSLLQEDFEN